MNKTLDSSATANPPAPFGPFDSATFAVADIEVMCAICDEYTPMHSVDYRAQRIFICDKCKAAVRHVRDILENGGSVV